MFRRIGKVMSPTNSKATDWWTVRLLLYLLLPLNNEEPLVCSRFSTCSAIGSERLPSFSSCESRRKSSVRQAGTRGGKVVLPSVNLSFVHLIRYLHYASFCNACPQLLNDVNYKLSGNNGLGIVDVKEECSSYSSNYSINEGNPSLQLYVVLYCVRWSAFVLL